MSLKAFHIVFIMASIFLSLGLGIWGWKSYQAYQQITDLVLGGTGVVSTFVLVVYLKSVFNKYKDVSYL